MILPFRPRRLRTLLGLVALGGLLVAGVGVAKADPPSPYTLDYIAEYGHIVCETLDAYPSLGGVEGVGMAIADDGFTYTDAGAIITMAVTGQCPRHLPLLQEFVDRYADTTRPVMLR